MTSSLPPVELSIIVALYNNASYISDCLESLERQSVTGMEVIILDDGSTDAPGPVLAPFLERNPSWRYLSQDNHGVGFTRNRAALLARGKYMGFLDSDDYVSDTMYSNLLDIARREDACVVLSNFSKIDANTGEEVTDRKDRYTELGALSKEDRVGHIFGGKIFGMACCSIFRTSLFLETGVFFPINTFHEDIFVLPRLYAQAKRIAACEDKGYVWRMRGDSESHSIEARHALSILHALTEMQDFLRSIGAYKRIQRGFTTHCIMYLNGVLRRIQATDNSHTQRDYLFDLLGSAAQQILKDKEAFIDMHRGGYGGFIDFYRSFTRDKPVVNAFRVKPSRMRACDVLFFPHKLYHTKTMLTVARSLRERGYSAIFVDMSTAYGQEAAYDEFDPSEFSKVMYEDVQAGLVSYSSSVFMNDWDIKCAMPTIVNDNANGRATFGIVEGIQDFWDMDTGRHRNAYQSVKYLIAAGDHDQKYFSPKSHAATMVGGVPRIAPLVEKTAAYPATPTALINSNFTYNVLENERENFLRSAAQAAQKAGFAPVVTRHPQDPGDLSNFTVTDEDMYTAIDNSSILISRFSSAIIEAVAMGKMAIYYNPGIEMVDKFTQPLGAFDVCTNEAELVQALQRAGDRLRKGNSARMVDEVRRQAADFLRVHCGIGEPGANGDGIAEFIIEHTRRMQQTNATPLQVHSADEPSRAQTNARTPDKDQLLRFSAGLLLNPEQHLPKLQSNPDLLADIQTLAEAGDLLGDHLSKVLDWAQHHDTKETA